MPYCSRNPGHIAWDPGPIVQKLGLTSHQFHPNRSWMACRTQHLGTPRKWHIAKQLSGILGGTSEFDSPRLPESDSCALPQPHFDIPMRKPTALLTTGALTQNTQHMGECRMINGTCQKSKHKRVHLFGYTCIHAFKERTSHPQPHWH